VTPYSPTDEQQAIIDHSAEAFVNACPGAGKTRTMVERARSVLGHSGDSRGIAFLSFTNAAVEELQTRLRAFGVLPVPLFPSFIGTFDGFLWQFFIAPFGVPGCAELPKLIPDKGEWEVKPPYNNARALPLKCFDRLSGKLVDAEEARKRGFNLAKMDMKAHETTALSIINGSKSRGQVDFDDVRQCVQQRLADDAFSKRLGAALAARFREVVVDEAQDCNPGDLAIINWLRQSGIPVKVICDPNQSIYGFRGGVTDELEKFAGTFDPASRLPMTGNFRSSPAVCSAIVMLRPPSARTSPDKPLGRNGKDTTPIHILSYSGRGVTSAIGATFRTLVDGLKLPLHDAPVVAATHSSAANAIGQPVQKPTGHKTLLLAEAVMNYHFSFAVGNRRDALVKLHRVVLLIQGHIGAVGEYHSYLLNLPPEEVDWRPNVIALANGLRFNPTETADSWLQRARDLLAPGIVGSTSIGRRLMDTSDLSALLTAAPATSAPARSIHSVKGLEFPAVCVVMTTATAGIILDFLEGKPSDVNDRQRIQEDARKIYVGASRAQRLLAIAIPKSAASRLQALLTQGGAAVQLTHI
jgi:hypothetical protein